MSPDEPSYPQPTYVQQPAYLPPLSTPGLSVRATFLASDGSRPQEIIIEWGIDPGQAALDHALEFIQSVASPGEARTAVLRPSPATPPSQSLLLPVTDPGSDEPEHCLVVGPGHDDSAEHGGCWLEYGHAPVEPDGRAHRCRCGGIFGTEEEHPAPPGRRTRQERQRER